jgi:hypothetical protein
MKSTIKKILSVTLQRPLYVKYCSQTIYTSLLACLRMWDATQEQVWRQRADDVLAILLEIQRPDGGFDIGYEFSFGMLHRVGESTAPETMALTALSEYAHRFGQADVRAPARRTADWIQGFALDRGEGRIAIPYGPYSIRDVMVANGTSFAAGALGSYLGCIEDDPELERIYRGMVRFARHAQASDDELAGRFWYYGDRDAPNLDPNRATKIDYYHQMQQVEVHALAEQRKSAPEQLDIVRDASDHIVALQDRHEIIPYMETAARYGGVIHTWGFSSVAAGLLEAAVLLPERRDVYHAVARRVCGWLIDNAWTGKHFHAFVTEQGEPVGDTPMVRSDAWVLSAMASACHHLGEGPWWDVVDPCFCNMAAVDFSGLESHASSPAKRATERAVRFILDTPAKLLRRSPKPGP